MWRHTEMRVFVDSRLRNFLICRILYNPWSLGNINEHGTYQGRITNPSYEHCWEDQLEGRIADDDKINCDFWSLIAIGLLNSKESEVDSLVPLTHHDPRDLGLICLVKKGKIRFWILSDLGIQFWIFLKNCTLRTQFSNCWLTDGYKSTMSGHEKCMPQQQLEHDLVRTCYRVYTRDYSGLLMAHSVAPTIWL